MKILAIGDVTSPAGLVHLEKRLWGIRRKFEIDFCVVNGENASFITGISKDGAEKLLRSGADVITGGNHTFKKKQIYDYLDSHEMAIRPANYPSDAPGDGYCIADCMGWRVLVINLLGTTFMDSMDSPFKVADRIISQNAGKYDICLVVTSGCV